MPSAQDASGADGASGAIEAGPADTAPQSDSRGPLVDGSSSGGPSTDADAEAGCPPGPPERTLWDGAIPATCGDRSADTDYDGVPDCADGCPYDPHKIAPGICGCNIADVDSDGDGVPDCIDICPRDPNNTGLGECGCVGMPGLKPAGTACTDSGCPQSGATCDGAGVCGDRSQCRPCPGGRLVTKNYVAYWFCDLRFPPVTGPDCAIEDGGGSAGVTRAAAESACAAKGISLVRIGSLDDNRFITQFLTTPAWIGANDLQTPGEWYWSSPTSDSDTLLWSGGPDGSRADSLFYNWASAAPGSNSCASINSPSGTWSDTDCNQMLGYVCKYSLVGP
jgi:lectin-like protein